jgi:hypothetical protein
MMPFILIQYDYGTCSHTLHVQHVKPYIAVHNTLITALPPDKIDIQCIIS